ncbi:Eaa protein [Salmonella enterica subsp. enterica serovar Virchow]|nr:Eaa protein [Salmonella enterica]EDD6083234.1 Eaa protein [Salmonella enterica subsp. enterica serovar Virchow]
MTITKERLLKIQHWRETYGADSNVMLPAEEAAELARIALASLEVAPVGEVSEKRRGLVMDGTVDLGGKSTYRIIKGEKAMKRLPLGTKFYIAPPAPVVDADPVVFTDERNLHHIARGRETSLIWGKQNQEVGDIPLYRHAQPVPVGNEFIPKNLDKAFGVVGVALPESKEEFNFQIERWIQRLIDRVIRYADEFKEQPVPVVPDEWTIQDAVKFCRETGRQDAGSAMEAWNACRAAMLHGDTFRENSISSTNNFREIAETSTNSPVIPDDWVMVPKEPTQAMIKAWLSEVANWRGHVAGYKAALAAAPQHEVK